MYIKFLNLDTEKPIETRKWQPSTIRQGPRIGSDVHCCPDCKETMSYSDSMGWFCRPCRSALRKTLERYNKTIGKSR